MNMTPEEKLATMRIDAVMKVDWDRVFHVMAQPSEQALERHLPALMDAYRSGREIELSAQEVIIADGLLELICRREVRAATDIGANPIDLLSDTDSNLTFMQRSFKQFLIALVALKESGQSEVQGIYVNIPVMTQLMKNIMPRLLASHLAGESGGGASHGPI